MLQYFTNHLLFSVWVLIKNISFTEWLQLVANIAAATAAIASWKAVSKTEEISTKPILSLKDVYYSEKGKKLSFMISNLSNKNSDRWARNITAKILGTKFQKNFSGFFSPEGYMTLEIEGLNRSDWQERILELSYSSFTNRVYTSKYLLPFDDQLTGMIDIIRIG